MNVSWFLEKGVTTLCFGLIGTTPEQRITLIMVRTTCKTQEETSLKYFGGIGCRGKLDGFRSVTTFSRQGRVAGSNIVKTTEEGAATEGSESGGEIRAHVVETFSTKYFKKF